MIMSSVKYLDSFKPSISFNIAFLGGLINIQKAGTALRRSDIEKQQLGVIGIADNKLRARNKIWKM